MDLLRLTALASCTLLACGQAGADPAAAPADTTSGLHAPAGWQALPEIATAVSAAARAEGITIDGAEAWGEPSMGCYAAWVALHGDGATAAQVMEGLEAAKLTVKDVVKPELGDDGLVSLVFERAPYRGHLRVRVATPRLTVLACFENEREPAACELACTPLLGALP